MAALDKIFELLDDEPDLVDADDATELPPIRGEIRFDDVCFAYGSGDDAALALCDVDIVIPARPDRRAGRATGAGKSTFAKLVARFHDPTRGAVLVDGHDVRSVTQESLRRQLGMVPQEAFLFSGTIARQHRLRPFRRERPTRSAQRPTLSAPKSSSSASTTATKPRSASAAGICRPASASWSRSHAPPSRIRGSSSWTRRRPTWISRPRRVSSTGCGGCWRGGRRSSLRIGCRRFAGRGGFSFSSMDGSWRRDAR